MRVYHKVNDTIPISFLVTHFPIRSNGRPLSQRAWSVYCNWVGFDDQFIKENYKEYLKGLKKNRQSKSITRYVVKTRDMA